MADSLAAELKTLLLAELASKGYAPNPADVHSSVDKVIALIEREKAAVEAKVTELEAKLTSLATPKTPATPVTPVVPGSVVPHS